MLLSGKTALVTGCLSGIGREAMELFARNGANVLACVQRREDAFESDIKRLAEETGRTITPIYFDQSNMDEVKAGLKQVMAAKTPVHILLNIAGIAQDALFHMTTMDSMRKVFEVNFFSHMAITQFVTKLMVRQKSGSVINVTSITATDGNPGQVSYGASKAALIGATKTLAMELGMHGIRVNVVAPGVIATPMTASIPPDALKKLSDRIPMKRLGTPNEVAGVMLYLASDLSTYVTGQVLRIDGGIE